MPMGPLFDFNGDGRVDALELTIAAGLLDAPDSPLNSRLENERRVDALLGLDDEDDDDLF